MLAMDSAKTAGTRHRGDYAYIDLLHGSSADQVRSLLANFDIGNDPLEQFQRSAAAVITAFNELGAVQRTVTHPMGNLPGSQLLSMRVTEWTSIAGTSPALWTSMTRWMSNSSS
jgi:hypothetical protein